MHKFLMALSLVCVSASTCALLIQVQIRSRRHARMTSNVSAAN
jgi:hypothetical protein